MRRLPFLRLLLVAIVALALLVALWAGLVRIGWAWPSPRIGWVGNHGPLMISGFFGTLIALERSVALGSRSAFVVPLLGAAGSLALVSGLPQPAGSLLLTLSSAGLVAINGIMVRRHVALHSVTIAAGALTLLVGNILWFAGRSIPAAVPWWVAFLVLTIVGERLELSRVIRPSKRALWLFAIGAGTSMIGLFLSLAEYAWGVRLMNLGFVALALWLVRYDIARKTVRRAGLTRFVAINLLLGYVWLAVGGLVGLRHAGITAGLAYDAWLHAILLGFVFGMVFAHALIILPAISGLTIPFRRVLYGPVLLMQAGLLIRVGADLANYWELRRLGGLINGLAILWFLVTVMALAMWARSGRDQKRHSEPTTKLQHPVAEPKASSK